VSWIPIIIFCSVSFWLGAFWHSKHAAELQRNRVRREVDRIAHASAEADRRAVEPDTRYSFSRRDLKDMGADK